jgi:hypothetical protein
LQKISLQLINQKSKNMKKLILSLFLCSAFTILNAQIIVRGVSPSAIANNYDFTWAEPSGGDWACPDFNIANTSVQDTIMMVDDGSTGLNAQGNPVSAEGCNPLINNLAGKIAILYRNTCEFGTKALNAQNAGAVGVIIINRDAESIGMGGGTDGPSVTIPVVMLSSIDGAILVNEMQNQDVVVFMGNKQGKYSNDGGSNKASMLISHYGSVPKTMADNGYSFDLGIQISNYGTNTNDFYVVAKIDGPTSQVYFDSIPSINMASSDTVSIFPGNTTAFAAMGITTWDLGKYTISYEIGIVDSTDDDTFDNMFSSDFYVTNDVLSLARQDTSTSMVLSNSYPYNGYTSGLRPCTMIQDVYPNTSTGVEGMYFSAYSNKASGSLDGAYVQAEILEWDDQWTGINGAWANITFNVLTQVGYIDYIYDTSHVNGAVVYAPFSSPVLLVDNQRYLVCLNTFSGTDSVSFGYDNVLDYAANISIYDQPVAALNVDNTWYSGWTSADAVSIGLKLTYDVGVIEDNTHSGILYPNPANDLVNISFSDINNFNANITIYDIMGKVIKSNTVNNVSNNINYDVSDLSKGTYIFNIIFEDGKTSNFNVVITR